MTARLVVLVSGSGSNLQALIDACADGRLDAHIVLVISNRKAAYALTRAQEAGIDTAYLPLKPVLESGGTREDYEAELARWIAPASPDLIVLAGWMHVLGERVLNAFEGRIINLHPALPGQFPGTDAIARTFDAYTRGEVTHGGCMVHEVIAEVDAGRVIAQDEVPLLPDDTLATFEARMHEAEHCLLVDAVRTVLGSR
jgi:formyltetrahydrofolate-dependent phosphoribosylglycinamide formyltransferase